MKTTVRRPDIDFHHLPDHNTSVIRSSRVAGRVATAAASSTAERTRTVGSFLDIAFGIILVSIFVLSAAKKASHLEQLIDDLNSHHVLPHAVIRPAATFLIFVEFVCASWLLLSLMTRTSCRFAFMICSALIIFFMMYAVIMLSMSEANGAAGGCGCGLPLFNGIGETWTVVVIRNGVMLSMSLSGLVLETRRVRRCAASSLIYLQRPATHRKGTPR